jgi:chitin disaccharide deacetylase
VSSEPPPPAVLLGTTRRGVADQAFPSQEGRTRLLRPFVVVLCAAFSFALPTQVVGQSSVSRLSAMADPILIVRSDDAGMSHSVNMALQKLIESGLPVSVSVMFPTPWYQETVEILKRHPEVSVGIHLTLNSEWKNYRWGPVLGRGTVPTLVDADGYFFATARALHENNPDIQQVEKELRAQIDRALRSGLRIDYVDYHMGTLMRYPEWRDLTERLAQEFGFGMSEYFGETTHDPQYAAAPAHKTDSLLVMIDRLEPRLNMLITHVGIDGPELGALLDMNTDGALPEMSKNRQGELDALTSQRFRDALKKRNVQLLTYRQLIEKQGLKSMRRPVTTEQ